MPNNISNVICIYSKFSSHCDRFLKECKEISNIKYICIDNELISFAIPLFPNVYNLDSDW